MKPLKFIHITKCGGTYIENISKKKNILWGRHDPTYGKKCFDRYPSLWHRIPKFTNNLEDYDWFMVVRNPYDRIISELHCPYGGLGYEINRFNPYMINKYIVERIKKRYIHGDHYTEQYKYLIENDGVKQHILKYENIEEEFNKLMIDYDLDLCFKKKPPSSKFVTCDTLYPDTIKLINKVYEKDFKLFDYQKIPDRKLRFIHISIPKIFQAYF